MPPDVAANAVPDHALRRHQGTRQQGARPRQAGVAASLHSEWFEDVHQLGSLGGLNQSLRYGPQLEAFQRSQFVPGPDPVHRLRLGGRWPSVLPDGAVEQSESQGRTGDARPTAGHATVPTAHFRIFLYGHPSRSGAVYDYFNIYPYINSVLDVRIRGL